MYMEVEKMKYEVMVSVWVLAYNHGNYIEHTIRSILEQKVDFKIEIIIHDDCSPDNTTEIIQKYEKEYPDIIKPIYEKENTYSKGINNLLTCFLSKAKGKYVASCEGDDYWIDNCKLQKQVDYMEMHPEVTMCATRNYIVDKNDEIVGINIDDIPLNRIFSKQEIFGFGPVIAHPSTWLRRLEIIKSEHFIEGMNQCAIMGSHYFTILYFANLGPIFVFDDITSAWRKVIEPNASNFTSRELTHPISYSLKQTYKYLEFQHFFGDDYDFSRQITSQELHTLINILTKTELGLSKICALKKLVNLTGIKEIICLIPHYLISRFKGD